MSGHKYRKFGIALRRCALIFGCLFVLMLGVPAFATIPTTYTVTFVENDSPSDVVETYQLGSAAHDLTLFADLSPAFSNSGHTFSSWNTAANGSGASYSDGALYSFASDLELYAQWASVLTTHTVTFAENDSSGDAVETYQLGSTPHDLTLFTDLSPAFANSGHTFSSWNTAANGSGASYSDGALYSFASDLELYAQWASVPNVTATFSGNGATGSVADESQPVGSAFSFPDGSQFVDPGYSFYDWNTASSGSGTAYAPGDSVVLDADQTFYAQWTPDQYVVTFAPDGGVVSPLTTEYSTDGTAITLPTPTNSGASFNGWFTAATGGTLIGLAGASYEPTQSLTLYAQWTTNPFVVTYAPNGGSVSPLAADYVAGGTAITLPAPTNSGASFKGWYTSATGGTLIGLAGASYEPTQSLTLYAQWTPSTNQIEILIDYGPGSSQVLSGDGSSTVTLPTTTTVSNPGFALTSWNTAANGTGTSYALGQSVTLTASLTLYPQWTAVGVVVVRFSANGGSGSVSPLSANVGSTVNLPSSSTLVRPGYTLTSWNTAANGKGISYAPGQSITLSAPLTLYAQWKATRTATLYGAVGLFARDSAILTSGLKRQVAQLAKAIKARGYIKVTLYGYAASSHSAAFDRSISAARSASVAAYLRSELSVLKVRGVAISSAGEGDAVGKSTASNSRVEVFVD